MLIRREALAGRLLDERFLCTPRTWILLSYQARGWQVWYNAEVTVLHYKGQSSRQEQFANVKFYETMRLFHDKHFKEQPSS